MPGKYRLVLFDPPWLYRARGSRLAPGYAGKGRTTAHYQPMDDASIAEYLASVSDELAADAIGLMWITNSALLEARHAPLLAALKMTAAQVIPWIKTSASGAPRMGGGNYTRVVSEHLILAARPTGVELLDADRAQLDLGILAAPEPAAGEHSLLLARRGRAASLVRHRGIAGCLIGPPAERRHSAKPDAQYDLAESLVEGPYLELFARRPRVGWDARGDQLASAAQASAPDTMAASA
jgi:N6-adenosine-specific RNA methylase IME4